MIPHHRSYRTWRRSSFPAKDQHRTQASAGVTLAAGQDDALATLIYVCTLYSQAVNFTYVPSLCVKPFTTQPGTRNVRQLVDRLPSRFIAYLLS